MVTRITNRSLRAGAALVLAFASLMPLVAQTQVRAYGLVDQRSIQISTSAASATGVTYKVKFNTATGSQAHQGIVIDFCSNSPIIGDACTAPAGFTVGASPSVTGVTNASGYSAASSNSGRTLTLTNASAASLAQGATIEFDITGVANPSASNATYYARIVTYDTPTNAGNYTATANGGGTGAIDAGGIALSTAAQITVTSKVQERLTFCVYTGANCAAGGTAVTLGDANGVLDTAGPYVDKNTKFDIATNATNNAVIRIKGPTLTSGSNTISAIGATKATTPGSPGTAEQFGFCAYTASGPALTIDAVYNGASGGSPTTECQNTSQSAGTATPGGDNGAYFAFDTNTTDGTGSTYGDVFATKAAGANTVGVIPFIGNITSTTEAGIYQTTLTFIATGTY